MTALSIALLCGLLVSAPTPKPPSSPASTPTAASKTPGARPAQSVPDQPYVGTPRPGGAKPYEAILKAKEAGASNKDLLAKVRREKVVYSLTTYDIQKLRAAGVSSDVIEAMMRSGRSGTTPVPTLPRPAKPTPGATAAPPR
jgi:hypothetical protein